MKTVHYHLSELTFTKEETLEIVTKFNEERGLKYQDDIKTPQEAADSFANAIERFSEEEKNETCKLLIKAIQAKRNASKNYLRGVINDAEVQKMDIEDLDNDLLKSVKRTWL